MTRKVKEAAVVAEDSSASAKKTAAPTGKRARFARYYTKRNGLILSAILLVFILAGFFLWHRHNAQAAARSNTNASGTASATKNADGSTTTASGTPDSATKSTDKKTTNPTPTSPGSPSPGALSPAPSTNPALPPAAYADNFSGHWYHNFGDMTLTQSGTHLTGTYHNGPAGSTGTVDGLVNGQVFTGSWHISGGTGPMVLTKTGDRLNGHYSATGGSTEYQWCGAKAGTSFPGDCGFARSWKTKTQIGTTEYQWDMSLTQTSSSITGTYGPDGRTVSGTISFSGGNQLLDGTWHAGSASGPFTFYLANLGSSATQKYFSGHYGSYQWCGGTSIANQPTPCLK